MEQLVKMPVLALVVTYYKFKEHRRGDIIDKTRDEVEMRYITAEQLYDGDNTISLNGDGLENLVEPRFSAFPPKQNIERVYAWCSECPERVPLGFEIDGVRYDNEVLNRVKDWNQQFEQEHAGSFDPATHQS
jgi:hypothetical protein